MTAVGSSRTETGPQSDTRVSRLTAGRAFLCTGNFKIKQEVFFYTSEGVRGGGGGYPVDLLLSYQVL